MEDGCFGNASRCCGHITHRMGNACNDNRCDYFCTAGVYKVRANVDPSSYCSILYPGYRTGKYKSDWGLAASDAGNRMYLFVPIPIIYHRDNFLFGFKFRCVNRSLGRNGDRSEAARKIWHEFWLHRIGFQRGTDRCKCGAAVGIKVIKK